MNVVALKSEWTYRKGCKEQCNPHPIKGNIYTVCFVQDYGGDTYYCILELGKALWNAEGFRPTDNTFGIWQCDIIEKEVEFELVILKGDL